MSVPILLQGKLLGIEEFLLSPAHESEVSADAPRGERLLTGRSCWTTLISEIIPRALLAELGLSTVFLGTSGSGQFLVVLPGESREQAEEFLRRCAADIDALGGSTVRLIWATTENLGDWSVVRKRLNEALQAAASRPGEDSSFFVPFDPPPPPDTGGYFACQLAGGLAGATHVGWSPESPGKVLVGEGEHVWPLVRELDKEGIPFARHFALKDNEMQPATLSELAARARGHKLWGMLRGDVDDLDVRLRRAQTIEEYVQLSLLYKGLLAGELAVHCSLPEFWQKVTVLYSGGNDFAVYGAWDALIPLARELQRLFHRFAEENLKDFPGPEGKSISMALVLAPTMGATLASVYREAGRRLEEAKSTDKDCFYVFGRVLEWKLMADAQELKDTLLHMAREHHSTHQFFYDLGGLYRKGVAIYGEQAPAPGAEHHFGRPWRFHRRIHRVFGGMRDKEFQKLRSYLIHDLSGRGAAQVKLRPAGKVALDWAWLSSQEFTHEE